MSAKQGDNRNKIVSLAVYGLLSSVCLIFGYVESLIPTAVIAPGVKIGLSNAVALLLLIKHDVKGAFLVNITRILLSALLFGSLFSLVFSLAGGIVSTLVSALLIKCRWFSPVGVSVIGGVTHNIVQICVAFFVVGRGVVFYLPILVISGVVSGFLIGILGVMLFDKIKINSFL